MYDWAKPFTGSANYVIAVEQHLQSMRDTAWLTN